MLSKISFLIAILLALIWVILFLIFNKSVFVHAVAILSFISFLFSFIVKNKE